MSWWRRCFSPVAAKAVDVSPGIVALKEIDPAQLDALEARMLEMVQSGLAQEIDIPVTHTFTPNTYVREGTMPAGALIIGHSHRAGHACIVLKGRMSLLNLDRTVTEIVAPCVFMGGVGRKVVFIHEDVLMQNIHETKDWPADMKTDVDALEDFLYAKTEAWKKHHGQLTSPETKILQ